MACSFNLTLSWSRSKAMVIWLYVRVHGSESKLDITRYWSKIIDCNLHHLYLALRLRWPRLNLADIFGVRKMRVPGLSYGVVCVILLFAVLVQCRLVTNRQTDRQMKGRVDERTHSDSIYRASIASRGKNIPLSATYDGYCTYMQWSAKLVFMFKSLCTKTSVLKIEYLEKHIYVFGFKLAGNYSSCCI